MQKILVFAGKKQSGKSSAANFVVGYVLSQLGRRGYALCPNSFAIDDEGQLIVNTITTNTEGETTAGDGVLDLNRKDRDFVLWASNIMWPHVKVYAFADLLKNVVVSVFGIEPRLVYGTDDDKNELTHITWKSMSKFIPPRQISSIKNAGKYDMKMTGRELLQYFGTNVCRVLDDSCWTRACINEILIEAPEIAIVQDCRFANEVKAMKQITNADVKVIKLEREVGFDVHDSENGLRGIKSEYDLIIDNEHMLLREKNQVILDALFQWGWFSTHLPLEKE